MKDTKYKTPVTISWSCTDSCYGHFRQVEASPHSGPAPGRTPCCCSAVHDFYHYTFFVLTASQFIPHIVQYVPDHASKSPIILLLRGPCVEDDKVRHPAGKKASGKVPRQQCLYNTRSAEKRPTRTLQSVRGQFYSSDSLFICRI